MWGEICSLLLPSLLYPRFAFAGGPKLPGALQRTCNKLLRLMGRSVLKNKQTVSQKCAFWATWMLYMFCYGVKTPFFEYFF
jgi:hypothetical protein